MNYYERHIGDYLKDTAHLSLLEHGIYTRLLDVYYTREGALPADQVFRLVGAREDFERAALRDVLNEFFTLEDGNYTHKRCERELERYRDKQRKASASATARWEKVRAHTERTTDAMRTHSEGNAPSNQTPDTINTPPTPSATSAIGAVGKALKGAGIDPQTINLADPILRSLVEQGATPEEFAGLAREAISGGKRNPIAWVLAVLPQRRSDAANVRLAAAPVVKSESSEDYVKRMAEEREAERKRLEGSTGPPPDLRDKVKAMVKGMRV